MKKINELSKKSKVILSVVTAIIILIATSGVYYASETNKLDEQTRFDVYWSIKLPTEQEKKAFNEHEVYKLAVIEQDRYYSYYNKDDETLNAIQSRINDLQEEVVYRKLTDKVNKVKVHEKANKTEKETFAKLQKEIKKMIENKKTTKDIDTKIEQLTKLKDVTDKRIKQAKETNQSQAPTTDYSDYSDYEDYTDYTDYSDYSDYNDYNDYQEPSYNDIPSNDTSSSDSGNSDSTPPNWSEAGQGGGQIGDGWSDGWSGWQ